MLAAARGSKACPSQAAASRIRFLAPVDIGLPPVTAKADTVPARCRPGRVLSALATHVHAARQQQHEQHDDQYPSPNWHCNLLVPVAVSGRRIARDAGG